MNKNKGFVILFAILIMGVIFALGAGLFSMAQKETLLSSTSSESQIALGAADTGMECGLQKVFTASPDFNCAGYPAIAADNVSGTQSSYSYDLQLINSESASCGVVTIDTANIRDVAGVATEGTLIESRGFNICVGGAGALRQPNLSDPLLIERKLIVWYANQLPTPPAPPVGGGGGPVVDPQAPDPNDPNA